jgi:hypothetical protein
MHKKEGYLTRLIKSTKRMLIDDFEEDKDY